jgi:hypothetical protein
MLGAGYGAGRAPKGNVHDFKNNCYGPPLPIVGYDARCPQPPRKGPWLHMPVASPPVWSGFILVGGLATFVFLSTANRVHSRYGWRVHLPSRTGSIAGTPARSATWIDQLSSLGGRGGGSFLQPRLDIRRLEAFVPEAAAVPEGAGVKGKCQCEIPHTVARDRNSNCHHRDNLK